jgi:hypothetical protein
MYSITENIYYSQLSSVAILLQPQPVSHRIIQENDSVFSPYLLSSFGLPLPPTCLVLTVSEARSYYASTIRFNTLLNPVTSEFMAHALFPCKVMFNRTCLVLRVDGTLLVRRKSNCNSWAYPTENATVSDRVFLHTSDEAASQRNSALCASQ